MDIQKERSFVIDEAVSWHGTPYHLNAHIKGVGVDCGWFIVESFRVPGLIPAIDWGRMTADFHLHRGEQFYLEWVLRYCSPIKSPPEPCDIILYRYGRILSHAAIIIDWPKIIHAPKEGCMYGSAGNPQLAKRQAGIFRLNRWRDNV